MTVEHNSTVCKVQATLTQELGEISAINNMIINLRNKLNTMPAMTRKIQIVKIEKMSASELINLLS